AEFMKDLDRELWKLGIPAKTSHNEVAPCQHELAPVFSVSNVAVDHNQITMELMKKIASRHGFACLLHEKPFEGVNGSGKHNNWSISTDSGTNLLEPGDSPKDNAQFLLFLTAVVKAVDEYQDLLRISVASAGNDHRLGANEAPPAIVSMFLGDELTEILEAIASGKTVGGKKKAKMALGVHVLPDIPKDTTDRNRTSPMAFTGNKFEFRMPGSSFSMAGPNVALNTAVASALRSFYEVLKDAPDFDKAVTELVGKTYSLHKRIVFNGNAYAPEWREEAEERGLLNLESAPDAFDQYVAQKNIDLFESFNIYTKKEIESRCEIHHEEYSKTIHIEALTELDMAVKRIIPAASKYAADLASGINAIKGAVNIVAPSADEDILRKVVSLTNELYGATNVLGEVVTEAEKLSGSLQSHFYREEVLPRMEDVRRYADNLELLVAKDYWPFPTYSDMLFYV
ncbi:MAG: glutamine synthetase type III, partial [Candidatus Ornithospirochaeta sp.]